MDQRQLTVRQRTFVKTFVENGGDGTQTALGGYNCTSPSSADAVARETLENPRVQQVLCEMMQTRGLDDDALLSKHLELLNDIDPNIRLRALDMAFKLRGAYKQTQFVIERSITTTTKPPISQPITVTREEMIEFAKVQLRAEQYFAEREKANGQNGT